MSTASPRILYLIQSAATTWQDEQRIQGNTDLPAAEEALAAMTAAAATFKPKRPLASITTGPDEASRQTARIIAKAVQPAPKIKVMRKLAEMNLGLWQGLTRTEVSERFTRAYNKWKADPSRVSPPEGESLDDASDRLHAALAKCLSKATADQAPVLVLRPVMMAIVRARLTGKSIAECLHEEDQPLIEHFELTPAVVRELRSARGSKRISA